METLSQQQLDEVIRSTPEIGLQTYEFFNGDKELREEAKDAFLADSVRNPIVDYPFLQPEIVQPKYDAISRVYLNVIEAEGLSEESYLAYEGTVGYRLHEAQMLLQACAMNAVEIQSVDFTYSATGYQRSNESLYGMVNDQIVGGIIRELRSMVDTDDLAGLAKDLYEEIEDILFDGLDYDPSQTAKLPILSEEARGYLAEKIERHYKTEKAAVDVIGRRLSVEGRDAFEPEDIRDTFLQAIKDRRYEGIIGAYIDSGSLLSWSQERKGVIIGDARKPIKGVEDVYGISVHEEGVHGQRFINGRSSDIPVLGNGLYVSDGSSENTDYLAFEEGIATLYQSIAAGKKDGWTIANFTHTLNLALAYKGKDFRDVYEANWKLRAVLRAKDGLIDEALHPSIKSTAYDSVLRIFRGTPIHRTPDLDMPLTYNKDLAYLRGRISAINFWNQNAGNDTMFDFVLAGKFDPTNKVQRAIAHTATRGVYE